MTLSLTCKHCKVVIEGENEDELVANVQAHTAGDVHERRRPEHRGHADDAELTPEHILSRLHRQQARDAE